MQTLVTSKGSSSSVVTGLFFITATVSAIIGSMLYSPFLNNPGYITDGTINANWIVGGAFSEVVLCCANIGTAIMLYPFLRQYNEHMGIGYVCFRFLEVVFIAIGIVSMLALLSVSKATVAGFFDSANAKVTGEMLRSVYRWAFLLGPNFILGINTFLYSYTFLKAGLVPRWLAIYGLIGALMILIAGVLLMFGLLAQLSITHLLMAMPIAVFEMVLAGWLIIRGFNLKGSAIDFFHFNKKIL